MRAITGAAKESIPLSGRELILSEAARLFVAEGYNGISMREIAEASQMTKAALYYHFKNKEDLFREIFVTYLAETQSIFQKALQSEGTIRRRLTQLIQEIFRQSPAERGIIHLIFIESSRLHTELRTEIGDQYHCQFLGTLEILLQEGVQSGELKEINPRLSAQILLGMMYPFFHPPEATNPPDNHEAIELMLTIFFDGISG